MTDTVTVTWAWGRSPMPIQANPQLNYLLVEAQPVGVPSVPVPLNFCLVLDRSGSMKGEKLANMKSATRRVIERLTPQDIVSIIIFDDTVQILLPATYATDQADLLAQVDTIEECGGTAMSLGMEAGKNELERYMTNDRISHMLVLTDGQTWGDESTCRSLAESMGQKGIRITALGVGAEWNEKLLDDLALLTNGVSDYIADPTQIDTFFQRTMQTVQGTAIRDARLLLRLVRDVTPRAVYRATPTIAHLGLHQADEHTLLIKMGDLSYGSGGSIIFEMMIPSRAPGSFRIAQGEIHGTPVGHQQETMVKDDVLLDFVTHETQAAYTPHVMNLVEKVTAFKLQTRALEEAEVGNIGAATQKLRAAATRLLDLGELELASQAQQQADQLEQGSGVSAEAQKALRYATRRLTQKLEE